MGEQHRKIEGRNELRKRDANTYIAGRQLDLASQRRAQSERQLGIEESLLGTDAQLNGQLGGVSAELAPFLSRYTFDSNAGSLKISGSSNKMLTPGFLQNRTDAANALLQQAEDAARSGDFATAEQLKAQAQTGLTSGKEFKQLGGVAGIEQIFQMVEDPAAMARSRLGNPQALIAGKQLQEARAFQDFNSEASVNERRLMSEAGERSLAAQQRTASRQGRNAALSGGAAQSAYGRNLSEERTSRSFGQDRAQLFAGVADSFQKMARAYGQNAVGFAQAFLQNQAGVREQFQSSLDQLKASFATSAVNAANQHQDMAQFQFMRGDAEKARSDARTAYYRDAMMGIVSMISSTTAAGQANKMMSGGGGGGGGGGGFFSGFSSMFSSGGSAAAGAAGGAASGAASGTMEAGSAAGSGAASAASSLASLFA